MNSSLIMLFTKTAFCCKYENGKSIYERLDTHFHTHGSNFPETEIIYFNVCSYIAFPRDVSFSSCIRDVLKSPYFSKYSNIVIK